MNLKITTLIENNPSVNSKLHNEHGLSLYIEIDETKILFDTGQSGDFIENAGLLKVDLGNLDYVLLSHGHYDHSGGFRKFVDKFKRPYKLILGKGFFTGKYKTTKEGTYKYIGNAFDKEFIEENNIPIKYIEENVDYITKDIMIFSNFKKHNGFESINKIFKLKQNDNYIADNFDDEIVLGVKSDKGLIIILGCSHIGIVNILETIIERTNMPIYGVVGGTHLVGCDELRLNNTINFLREKDIKILALSHCTGEKAIQEIQQQFGKKFVYNNTGSIIKI